MLFGFRKPQTWEERKVGEGVLRCKEVFVFLSGELE